MSHNLPESTDDEPSKDDLVVTNAAGESEVKDIDAVSDDHPLVQETGRKEIKAQTSDGLGEFLSSTIYEHDSVFVREYLQNSESACIRAAKHLLRNTPEFDTDKLTVDLWVKKDSGETLREVKNEEYDRQAILAEFDVADENLRRIERPRRVPYVMEQARQYGYDPTIEIEVHRDDQRIIWQDNGIGMTAMEVSEAFMTNFNSGSALEDQSGGKFGIGAKTHGLVTGKYGGMRVETCTRRIDAPEQDQGGIHFYAYLGGANPLSNDEMDDGFKGTKFNIPVQDDFNLADMQDWVEKYAEILNVPVLYREFQGGKAKKKEEYGGVDFIDYHDDPPVIIDRPGEFTAVAGPKIGGFRAPDTWLVSMQIDRNAESSVRCMWDVAVQIHDEQGRIVAGPNRGKKHGEVDLHEDDVPLPQPTGDRDRFQRDVANKRFFEYLEEQVTHEELNRVSKLAYKMDEEKHPADALEDEGIDEWKLFKKGLVYHGPYNIKTRVSRLHEFFQKRDEMPDWDKENSEKVHQLFTEVSVAGHSQVNPDKKSRRNSMSLGKVLANSSSGEVFMAASISAKAGVDRCRVVYETFDDSQVIVIKSASDYESYEKNFGFKKLKNVPRKKSDDHGFDVPDGVHKKVTSTVSEKKNSGKADDIKKRKLKFRTDSDNKNIDYRYSVEKVKERLEEDKTIGGHRNIVLFPGGQDNENISDHYEMAKFAAIASVSQKVYDKLSDNERVLQYEEFIQRSKETAIATENGPMTVEELMDNHDHISFLLDDSSVNMRRFLDPSSESKRVLEHLREFAWKNMYYATPDNGSKDDVVFAIVDNRALERANVGLYKSKEPTHYLNIIAFSRYSGFDGHLHIDKRRCKSLEKYKNKARTPNWDNASSIYLRFGSREWIDATLRGLHDAGIHPNKIDADKLETTIATNLRGSIGSSGGDQ